MAPPNKHQQTNKKNKQQTHGTHEWKLLGNMWNALDVPVYAQMLPITLTIREYHLNLS